ncbi:hypothetical protein CRUP_035834 [Coryphaenoides rupestris]|nr:hypothetical protein CRUP_035834 [Coryphaenoides rupestris]
MGVCTGGARAGPGIVKALSLRDTPLPGSSTSNRQHRGHHQHVLGAGVLRPALATHPSKMAASGSSAASRSSSSIAGGKPSGPTAEQVVGTFQKMRQEQRSMASKASEFEMENNEHSLVIETLKEVDPSRKCFRLVGGVLVERTITKIIETLTTQMQAKGRELTEYRERYNIRLVGEGEGEGQSPASRESEGGASKGGTGVLVS